MNAIVELLVTGLSGSTAVGSVDLFGDEPIQLNLSIANIKNISQRNTTFTQNFSIPGTPNNNKLFNNIFEIGSNGLFNPAHKTPCQLLVDTVPVVANGVLQLTDISIDDQKNITYMVTIFDDATDILDNIGTLELTDLQFSGLNHTWNETNITNTWTGTTQPYIYPLIDYGNDFDMPALNGAYNSGLGVTIDQVYPAIQTKQVIDRIFSAAGYTYSSNFFNSDYFNNLYLPFNGSVGAIPQSLTVINQNSFNAVLSASSTYTVGIQGASQAFYWQTTLQNYAFNNVTVFPGFNGGGYDPTFFEFSPNVNLAMTMNVDLNVTYTETGGGSAIKIVNPHVQVIFRRHGVIFDTKTVALPTTNAVVNTPYQFPTISSVPLIGPYGALNSPAVAGDSFDVRIEFYGSFQRTGGSGGSLHITLNPNNSMFYNTVYPTLVPNTTIPMNEMVPKKVKQIDFLNSIVTMHNLYIVPNKLNPKNLIIEPRDDYNATGVIRDWSNKVDLSQTVTESLLSEQQNKRIIFTYKLDSDFFNTDYNTVTKKIFGDEYVVIDNDFTKDDKTITTIFSSTPSVAVLDSSFVPPSVGQFNVGSANDFVIPKIGKVDNSSGSFSSTDCNIRILQKFSGNTINLSGSESWKMNGTTYTAYPYLGMLNHPSSGDTDIAFGTVDYEYYALSAITNNNLVNKYYRTYLDQIIDKDSKLITCQMYLTPADIQQFNFCDTIFVDSLASNGMGGYFLVNSIKYTPTTNTTSTVELILVKEVVSSGIIYPAINHRVMQPLSVLSLGGGKTYSTNSIAMGNTVLISNGSAGSVAIGSGLNIGGGSQNNLLMGSGSTIGGGVNNSLSIGNGNVINNGSTNALVFGNNVTVGTNSTSGFTGTTLTGVTVFGSNITATTNNTVYVNNLQITSGGTINNISISAITVGANIWTTGSTGIQNIKAVNVSTIDSVGQYSYAEGGDTLASGYTAHAEGDTTSAINDGAHAEGGSTTASGIYSHAEGDGTSATTHASHSEGSVTLASGAAAHSEGYLSTAQGVGSHAEGGATFIGLTGGYAHGDGSHAEGVNTTSFGLGSHAEGYLTYASGVNSHAEGGNWGTTTSGGTAIGAASHAEGEVTLANGEASHAEGYNTSALALASHSEGSSTIANSQSSHAEGGGTLANGNFSHAEGSSSTTAAVAAHAEGVSTTANGQASHAEGIQSFSVGDGSHSEGRLTTAIGFYSHAEGSGTTASGITSHSEGFGTTAQGDYSHAEGNTTTAFGTSSHAEGLGTFAGTGSHAEGLQTTAIFGSHAEGFNTSAGNSFGTATTYSHSEGISTQATGLGAHAEGSNTASPANYGHAGGLNAAAENTGEWARSSGGGTQGDQYGTISLYKATTNATPAQAFVGGTGIEKFVIPVGSARYCRVYVIVMNNVTQDSKQFKGEGVIKNIASTTSLVGSFTMSSTNGDVSLTTASIAVTAGGATQDLVVTVTGVAATNLDWFIRIDYEQVF